MESAVSPNDSASQHESRLREILARLSRGDATEEAWTNLYVELWPYIIRTCSRNLGDAYDAAEDAAQEVFMRLAKYYHFRETEPYRFRAYVKRVCVNVCRAYLKRFCRLQMTDFATVLDLLGAAGGNEELLITAALKGSLTTDEAALLEFTISGCTVDETAERLQISYGAAAVRLHRLRKKIRFLLARDVRNPLGC